LEVGDGVFEVLSTSGDTHLGGDDFDKVRSSGSRFGIHLWFPPQSKVNVGFFERVVGNIYLDAWVLCFGR
jgi:hypothetical protein